MIITIAMAAAALVAAAPISPEPTTSADQEAALIAAVAPVASFSGTGTQAIDISTLPEAPYVVDVTYDSDDYLIIDPLDANYETTWDTIYVNTDTLPFSGRFPLNLNFLGSVIYAKYLQVDGEGSWTIDILPWAAVQPWHGGEAHGLGPTVLAFDGEPGIVTFAHNTPDEHGDFYVNVVGSGDYEYEDAIDESGTVEGTAFIPYSPSVVTIDAAGEWWLRR
jgi:hypothetical protein